jgi:nucleotide-binding universal stress UspA family protein
MLDVKKILAPVDLGPESRKVLGAAGEIAALLHSEVVAMHVVQPVPPLPMAQEVPPGSTASFNVPVYQSTLEEQAEASLEDLTAAALPEPLPRALLVRTGRIAPSILEECRSGDYDLVVVGTGAEQGGDLDNMLFGSIAQRVVENAPAPVLVLRGKVTPDEEDDAHSHQDKRESGDR